MNPRNIANLYDSLSPQERNRLMLAAHFRKDQAEFERLKKGRKPVSYSIPDYCHFAEALNTSALQFYISLLAESSSYLDALASSTILQNLFEAHPSETDNPHREERDYWFDLTMAYGYRVQTYAEAWKRFCTRLHMPPQEIWDHFPGYAFVHKAMLYSRIAAFTPEQMLNWFNSHRADEEPEMTTLPVTVDAVFTQIENSFEAKLRRA